jgi:hypothetical protein
MLLETDEGPHVKVCGTCEEEVGPQRMQPGEVRTHTYCKRHLIGLYRQLGNEAKIKEITALPDANYAPDLAQHPELADAAGREAHLKKKQDFMANERLSWKR